MRHDFTRKGYTFWMGFETKEGRLSLFLFDNLPLSIKPVYGQLPANLPYEIVCDENDFFAPQGGIETPFLMKVTMYPSQDNKPPCIYLNQWNTVIEDVPLHILEDLAYDKQIGLRFQEDVDEHPTSVINQYQLQDYFEKPLKKLEEFINSTKEMVNKYDSEDNKELMILYFKKQVLAEDFLDCFTILLNNLNNNISLNDWLKISNSFKETLNILND